MLFRVDRSSRLRERHIFQLFSLLCIQEQIIQKEKRRKKLFDQFRSFQVRKQPALKQQPEAP